MTKTGKLARRAKGEMQENESRVCGSPWGVSTRGYFILVGRRMARYLAIFLTEFLLLATYCPWGSCWNTA